MMLPKRYLRICPAAVFLCCLMLPACRPKRPYGTERIGRIADLMVPETYVKDRSFLVRYDQDGFSVMSTMCTRDLSPLVLKRSGSSCEFVSRYTTSRYDCYGKVLNGPATRDLPYYEIFAAPGEYETRGADTLYAWVGREKPPSWRFKIRR